MLNMLLLHYFAIQFLDISTSWSTRSYYFSFLSFFKLSNCTFSLFRSNLSGCILHLCYLNKIIWFNVVNVCVVIFSSVKILFTLSLCIFPVSRTPLQRYQTFTLYMYLTPPQHHLSQHPLLTNQLATNRDRHHKKISHCNQLPPIANVFAPTTICGVEYDYQPSSLYPR